MNSHTAPFVTEARATVEQALAAAEGLTGRAARAARPVAQHLDYVTTSSDIIGMEYNHRSKGFIVHMSLTSNVARAVTFQNAVADAGVMMLNTDGNRTAYALEDAEIVETIVRDIF